MQPSKADFIEKSYFALLNKSLAAPALRRLGRAGLEALPLRARKFLSFYTSKTHKSLCKSIRKSTHASALKLQRRNT